MLYQLSYEATHWERGQFIEFLSPHGRYELNKLQEVSLEYDILQWNKMKQIICISKKYSCFTKTGITSIALTITQHFRRINNILGIKKHFRSYVTILSHFEGGKELSLNRIKLTLK